MNPSSLDIIPHFSPPHHSILFDSSQGIGLRTPCFLFCVPPWPPIVNYQLPLLAKLHKKRYHAELNNLDSLSVSLLRCIFLQWRFPLKQRWSLKE